MASVVGPTAPTLTGPTHSARLAPRMPDEKLSTTRTLLRSSGAAVPPEVTSAIGAPPREDTKLVTGGGGGGGAMGSEVKKGEWVQREGGASQVESGAATATAHRRAGREEIARRHI